MSTGNPTFPVSSQETKEVNLKKLRQTLLEVDDYFTESTEEEMLKFRTINGQKVLEAIKLLEDIQKSK